MEILYILTYFIVFIAWGVIRFQFQKQYKITHQVKVVEKKPQREWVLVRIVGFSTLISTLLWVATLIDFAKLQLPDNMRLIGIPVGLFSAWYFYKVHEQLGKNWSPVLEIRKEHNLVVTGLYRYVRHPMYSSMAVWWAGNIFLTANWLLLLIQGLGMLILFIYRIPDEEKMMVEQFGAQYLEYAQKTKRLIPYVL
jgi:protein-S-isoprenylcysteine O-methyltransferase Ste14